MVDWWSLAASLGAVLACGYPMRGVGRRVGIPPAVPLMAVGMILGPELLDWLSSAYLQIAPTLSKAAFVVLLLRVSLGIALRALRGRVVSVLVIGLIPALVELAIIAVATKYFVFHRWDLALLAGFLLASVSPAVILPAMLDQKEKGRGSARVVPDQIMAMAVLNAFLAQTGILILLAQIVASGADTSAGHQLMRLPLAVTGGIAGGFAVGYVASLALSRLHDRGYPDWLLDSIVLLTGVGVYASCTRLGLESVFATLAVGVAIRRAAPAVADAVRASIRRLWDLAEIVLFVGLGAIVNLSSLADPVLITGLLVLSAAALGIRVASGWLCTIRTDMSLRERFYISLAQIPKATLQAVFGPMIFVQLSGSAVGLSEEGQTMLVLAVLSILTTAPLGAVVLHRWGRLLLAPTPSA